MGIGRSENEPQARVIALFRDVLSYRYLRDWTDSAVGNIDEKC